MGKLFVLIGKSASGKDTVMRHILADCPHIKKMVSYTTRPMRDGEENGREYHFVSEAFFEKKRRSGEIIEERVYESKEGTWLYGTIDEGESFVGGSYVAIKDPKGAKALKEYYGEENVVTILVTVDDGIRLMRALTREMSQKNPNYEEICERFLKEQKAFKDVAADFVVENSDVTEAVNQLKKILKSNRKGQQ